MSTTTPDAATASLKLVAVEQSHIPEGGNPRKRFDERALQELADSIGKHGVLQPLVVRTSENGYTLIAGERRYRAAKLAGLKQLPVTLRDGDDDSPLELAVDENLHRQDLDPVEEAHAFHAILSSGRMNKKQLAERVSKSASYVNDRLRLLGLPEPIQEHVGSGTIPVRLAKQLIEMAKASEPVASACVQLVVNHVVKVDELEERPERLIGFLGDYEWPDPQPIALGVSSYHQYPLESLPLPAEGCDDIRERHAGLGEEVGFRFDQEDADAARGYGCLLEFKDGKHWSSSFITDPAFIADRVRLKLDSYERELKKRERAAAREQDESAPQQPVDIEKEQRRQERQQQAEAKQAAISANFELGRKLQLRYDAPKITTPLAKLLALLILDGQADKLAGRGLRYTREDWQIVESKEVRGKTVEKNRYPDGDEAAAQLYASIERARSPEQVIGRLLQALIAAHAADPQAVPVSSRVYWQFPGRYDDGLSSEIPTTIERLARSVLPRQLAAKGESSGRTSKAA
jgi:ParB family transcriptional regulator, chromosome partitioning protein